MVVGYQVMSNASLPQKDYMRSATETKYRKSLNDKLTMLAMFWIFK